MKLVACITFGHRASDLQELCEVARATCSKRRDASFVIYDDCSGAAPQLDGVDTFEGVVRLGFAGALNVLASERFNCPERIVLLNPDALLSCGALERLLDSEQILEVPRHSSRGSDLANVLRVTTPMGELRNLFVGQRRRVQVVLHSQDELLVECPPYAPSGAVISIDGQAIRETPFDSDLFWLEFSDWVLRRKELGRLTVLKVNSDHFEHSGASTSLSYPLSVAASQARAKAVFIRRYGSRASCLLLPFALFSKSVRFGIVRRSVSAAVFLMLAGSGVVDWRVPR